MEEIFGSVPDVQAPEMSAEQQELLGQMSEAFGIGLDQLEALAPEFMRQSRFREIDRVELTQEQLDERAELQEQIDATRSGAKRDKLQAQFDAIVPEGTTYERMSYNEWLDSLDPDERESELIKVEGRSNLQRLLRGDAEDIPGVGAMLDQRRQDTHASLLRRGIRPGSTASTNAMETVENQSGLFSEQLKTGQFQLSQAAAQGVPAGVQPGALNIAGLTLPFGGQAFGAAGQQQGMQFQADIANAQAAAQASSDIWGAAGFLGGAAIVASSEEFKEDIQNFDSETGLEMIRKLPIRTFKYKEGIEDSDYHIGMITEESPIEITTNNRRAIKLYDSIGLTIAGVKALDDRLRKLEMKEEDNG